LTATRQKHTPQVQVMTQDLGRANADLQQVPALKSEIEGLRQELCNMRGVLYLIYEDLHKGSLVNVLYGVGAVSGLHWGTRVNIGHGLHLR
ncbi:FLX-like protein 1, partial [Tanacetum coccineum]